MSSAAWVADGDAVFRQHHKESVAGIDRHHQGSSTATLVQLAMPGPEERVHIRRLAANVAKASLEVLAGTRQPKQLVQLLSPEVFGTLQRRAELTQQARALQPAAQRPPLPGSRSPQIRSAHGCAVSPGIYEISVLAAEGTRYRAIALRIEQHFGKWLVTVLQIG